MKVDAVDHILEIASPSADDSAKSALLSDAFASKVVAGSKFETTQLSSQTDKDRFLPGIQLAENQNVRYPRSRWSDNSTDADTTTTIITDGQEQRWDRLNSFAQQQREFNDAKLKSLPLEAKQRAAEGKTFVEVMSVPGVAKFAPEIAGNHSYSSNYVREFVPGQSAELTRVMDEIQAQGFVAELVPDDERVRNYQRGADYKLVAKWDSEHHPELMDAVSAARTREQEAARLEQEH